MGGLHTSEGVLVDVELQVMGLSKTISESATMLGLKELWALTKGSPSVLIAVLDGPINHQHPSFISRQIEVLEAKHEDVKNPDTATKHGTHVTSIILSGHDSEVKGIAPDCHGLVVPIFRTNLRGDTIPCSQSDLVVALNKVIAYAVAKGYQAVVVNISSGQVSKSGSPDPLLADFFRNLNSFSSLKDRVLIVAAAGNQGCDCVQIPASIPDIIAVGSMDHFGEPLDFSNWGDAYARNGILAPGANIVGADAEGGIATSSGTSYSAALVSGIAGLLFSLQIELGSKPSSKGVRASILDSAEPCNISERNDCRKFLAGKLSIESAVKYLVTRNGDLANMSKPDDSTGITQEMPQEERQQPKIVNTIETQVVASGVGSRHIGEITPSGMLPAGCGCGGGTSKKVYTIGKLSYSFPTAAARESFQARMDEGVVQDPIALMRHIFKWTGDVRARPNLREASRVLWLLEYGGVPRYILNPDGMSANEDLEDIIYDYLEQEGLATHDRNLLLGPGVARLDLAQRPDHFAIPGVASGKSIPVEGLRAIPLLTPLYDLTTTWNLDAVIGDAVGNGIIDGTNNSNVNAFRQMATALYSFIDAKGDTNEGRAINFIASAAVDFASKTKFLDGTVALRGLSRPVQLDSARDGEMVYEVVAQYFNVLNTQHAMYHVRYVVDVTDIKPRLLSVSNVGFGSGQFL